MPKNENVSGRRKAFVYVLLFVVIVLSLILVAILAHRLFSWIMATIDEQILAAIITGAFTIFVTAISILVAKNFEHKKQIEQQIRLKKLPIYEDFLEFWFKILLENKTGKKVSQREMANFFAEFTQKIIVWGSDEFIKDYGKFRDLFPTEETNKRDNSDVMTAFEGLLLSIRKDTGHKNKNIKHRDLLRLFVTDLHKIPDEKE